MPHTDIAVDGDALNVLEREAAGVFQPYATRLLADYLIEISFVGHTLETICDILGSGSGPYFSADTREDGIEAVTTAFADRPTLLVSRLASMLGEADMAYMGITNG